MSRHRYPTAKHHNQHLWRPIHHSYDRPQHVQRLQVLLLATHKLSEISLGLAFLLQPEFREEWKLMNKSKKDEQQNIKEKQKDICEETLTSADTATASNQ